MGPVEETAMCVSVYDAKGKLLYKTECYESTEKDTFNSDLVFFFSLILDVLLYFCCINLIQLSKQNSSKHRSLQHLPCAY